MLNFWSSKLYCFWRLSTNWYSLTLMFGVFLNFLLRLHSYVWIKCSTLLLDLLFKNRFGFLLQRGLHFNEYIMSLCKVFFLRFYLKWRFQFRFDSLSLMLIKFEILRFSRTLIRRWFLKVFKFKVLLYWRICASWYILSLMFGAFLNILLRLNSYVWIKSSTLF